jgi:hypothetical protein
MDHSSASITSSWCGATPEEALCEVRLAKAAWLEAASAAGKPIPRPKCQPAICGFAP